MWSLTHPVLDIKIKLLLILISFFICLSTLCQVTISGKLLNGHQKPIGNVIVTCQKISSPALRGFSKTSAGSTFKLTIKITGVDSVKLDFNHLSYAKHGVNAVNATANYINIFKS